MGAMEKNIFKYSDEEKKSRYMKEVARMIADGGKEDSAPYIAYKAGKLREEWFGGGISVAKQKYAFDRMVLEMEADLDRKIQESDDPLKTALLYDLTLSKNDCEYIRGVIKVYTRYLESYGITVGTPIKLKK